MPRVIVLVSLAPTRTSNDLSLDSVIVIASADSARDSSADLFGRVIPVTPSLLDSVTTKQLEARETLIEHVTDVFCAIVYVKEKHIKVKHNRIKWKIED